jgi:hypothetical protein
MNIASPDECQRVILEIEDTIRRMKSDPRVPYPHAKIMVVRRYLGYRLI